MPVMAPEMAIAILSWVSLHGYPAPQYCPDQFQDQSHRHPPHGRRPPQGRFQCVAAAMATVRKMAMALILAAAPY